VRTTSNSAAQISGTMKRETPIVRSPAALTSTSVAVPMNAAHQAPPVIIPISAVLVAAARRISEPVMAHRPPTSTHRGRRRSNARLTTMSRLGMQPGRLVPGLGEIPVALDGNAGEAGIRQLNARLPTGGTEYERHGWIALASQRG
jgi:hypothetical protein